MSRPEKPIDWNKVDQLLMAGCFGTEIAPHFDIHVKTFYDKVVEKFNITFTEYSALKKNQGDSLLKAKQFEKALKGDNTLLIWLGKTRLNQREPDSVNDIPPLDLKVEADNENMKLKAQLANALEKISQYENQSKTG